MGKRIAWIVGGSRGIGYACAEALGKEDYALAISSRNNSELDEAAATLRSSVEPVLSVKCDISKEEEVKAAFTTIVEHFGEAPHILINSAGISPWDIFSETTTDTFDAVIAVNTRGVFLTSREVLPAMYERKEGAIVQILSVASIKAYKNGAAYVASKFAALGFTNALREEARQHGVRVIAVLPGATETELWGATEREEFHDRMMQPEDIAQAVVAALRVSNRALMEEILLRPIQGDI
jgi:NAD(P)-dependent dehydrogenase (short-subunit alcohol dehydrogenase family)